MASRKLIVAGVLAALGALWGLSSLAPRTAPPRAISVMVTQEIRVSGKIPQAPAGTRLVFSFPEATLDVEKRIEELDVKPDGSFTALVSVQVEHPPKRVRVSARRAGYADSPPVEVAIVEGAASAPPVALNPLPRLVSEKPRPAEKAAAGGRDRAHQRLEERRQERREHRKQR